MKPCRKRHGFLWHSFLWHDLELCNKASNLYKIVILAALFSLSSLYVLGYDIPTIINETHWVEPFAVEHPAASISRLLFKVRPMIEEMKMQDFWFLAVVLAFFAAAIGYTHGCDKL